MRNLIATAALASFTAACSGLAPKNDTCVVTIDGNDRVRRADILSSQGKKTHYGESFTEVADGVWQGSIYDANGEQLNALITVDLGDEVCDTVSAFGTTSAPIFNPPQ